ncbi:MAG: hypothetical protein AB7O98_00450 [Hyphomonadaceae bacterium]
MFIAPDISCNRAAPPALWRMMLRFLRLAFYACGGVDALTKRRWLDPKTHAFMLSWVRNAERMMRRLLLAEAAALGPLARIAPGDPHARAAAKTARSTARRACRSSGFVVLPRLCTARTGPRRRYKPKRRYSALGIAARLGALHRVLAAPLPYAKRLARTFKQPGQIFRVKRTPPPPGAAPAEYAQLSKIAAFAAALLNSS